MEISAILSASITCIIQTTVCALTTELVLIHSPCKHQVLSIITWNSMLSQFLFPPSILNRSIAPSFMYFFAQLSNYSVRCGAEFPADICSIRFKALYFQVISDGRQYNFHLPRNLLPELLSETGTFSLSSSSSSSFVWYSSPCWDHRDHDARPAPPPARGQDPPGFSLRSWKIYLPKLRTVFNFKITCYESSTLDFVAPFRCLNAWRHSFGESVLMFEST